MPGRVRTQVRYTLFYRGPRGVHLYRADRIVRPARSRTRASRDNLYQDSVRLREWAPWHLGTLLCCAMTTVVLCVHCDMTLALACCIALTMTIIIGLAVFVKPIAQPVSYHAFADVRVLCACGVRVPNYADVLSNLPFVLCGALGLELLGKEGCGPSWLGHVLRAGGIGPDRVGRQCLQLSEWERTQAWPIFFLGILLTSVGSAYYHYAPSNDTLVWDRLPMTMSFMSLFAIIVDERVGHGLGTHLLCPCLVLGGVSVLYWHVTEKLGRGDLRPYIVVQGLPLVSICLLLLTMDGHFTRGHDQMVALLWYAFAKYAEAQDRTIYYLTNQHLSGHTLKHLSAALVPLWLAAHLLLRETSV